MTVVALGPVNVAICLWCARAGYGIGCILQNLLGPGRVK